METPENKVAKYGKALIIDLSILIRAAGIYERENDTIRKMAAKLLEDIRLFLEDTGDVTLKVIEGSFYIEGIRVKAGISDIDTITALASEFGSRSIGVFDFSASAGIEDMISLAYLFRRAADASDLQGFIDQTMARGIAVGGPVVLYKEEGVDLKDQYSVARKAYVKAFMALKEMQGSLRTGMRTKLKRTKRAVQLLVDCILTDERFLLAFTTPRQIEDYSFYHSVNVAILSTVLGKRAGLERHHLRTLAVTGLLHDIGKMEMPEKILNKKDEFSQKEQELLRQHPIEGIRILLKSFGLSDLMILSMLVSYEHHMKMDLSGYPAISQKRTLNLFSRIVEIADEYESLVSGRVYGRQRLDREEAFKRMSEDAGTAYDPVLLKAFKAIFR